MGCMAMVNARRADENSMRSSAAAPAASPAASAAAASAKRARWNPRSHSRQKRSASVQSAASSAWRGGRRVAAPLGMELGV